MKGGDHGQQEEGVDHLDRLLPLFPGIERPQACPRGRERTVPGPSVCSSGPGRGSSREKTLGRSPARKLPRRSWRPPWPGSMRKCSLPTGGLPRRQRAWKFFGAPLMPPANRSPRRWAASLRAALTDEPTRQPAAALPPFVPLLAAQPRAGATRPGYPRVILEPAENHAEHCAVVAVNGVLAAGCLRRGPCRAVSDRPGSSPAQRLPARRRGRRGLAAGRAPTSADGLLPRPGFAGTPGVSARPHPPLPDGGLPRRHPGGPGLPGRRFRGSRPGNGMACALRGFYPGSRPGRNGHHPPRPGPSIPTSHGCGSGDVRDGAGVVFVQANGPDLLSHVYRHATDRARPVGNRGVRLGRAGLRGSGDGGKFRRAPRGGLRS